MKQGILMCWSRFIYSVVLQTFCAILVWVNGVHYHYKQKAPMSLQSNSDMHFRSGIKASQQQHDMPPQSIGEEQIVVPNSSQVGVTGVDPCPPRTGHM